MSDLKVYEVMRNYITEELYHVTADSEEDAIKQFKLGERRYINSYTDEYSEPKTVQIEGPWDSEQEYEEDYEGFIES